jgi:hypothetical protein
VFSDCVIFIKKPQDFDFDINSFYQKLMTEADLLMGISTECCLNSNTIIKAPFVAYIMASIIKNPNKKKKVITATEDYISILIPIFNLYNLDGYNGEAFPLFDIKRHIYVCIDYIILHIIDCLKFNPSEYKVQYKKHKLIMNIAEVNIFAQCIRHIYIDVTDFDAFVSLYIYHDDNYDKNCYYYFDTNITDTIWENMYIYFNSDFKKTEEYNTDSIYNKDSIKKIKYYDSVFCYIPLNDLSKNIGFTSTNLPQGDGFDVLLTSYIKIN